MLRYFCILTLLICVQWIFCYDEIYDRDIKNSRYDRRFRNRIQYHNAIDRDKNIHHEYEELERNPVAEFDVASFIQNPEEEAVEENDLSGYKTAESLQPSKYYSEYGSSSNLINNLDIGADNNPDLNLSPALSKDTINTRHSNMNGFDMGNEKIVQSREDEVAKGKSRIDNNKSEKKCPFKNMKIPFFSRSKSDKQKFKKNKKRKLFSMNGPKNDNRGIKPTLNVENLVVGTEDEYKLNKRSYQQRLCPACEKKFIENKNAQAGNTRRSTKKLFHNSRQFFHDINDIENRNFEKDLPSKDELIKGNTNNLTKRRREIKDVDRQMKELQEVEKKVNDIEMKTPILYQKYKSQTKGIS